MSDQHTPLTAAEIEELKEEIRAMPHKEFFGENLKPLVDDHSRLSALLTPPTDAAVREAVERLERRCDLDERDGWSTFAVNIKDIRTLLCAVQPPRLTGEQKRAALHLLSEMDKMLGEDIQPEDDRPAALAMQCFCAAFPGVFGQEG